MNGGEQGGMGWEEDSVTLGQGSPRNLDTHIPPPPPHGHVSTGFGRHLSEQQPTPSADPLQIPWQSGSPPGAPARSSLGATLGRALVRERLKRISRRGAESECPVRGSEAGNFAHLPQQRGRTWHNRQTLSAETKQGEEQAVSTRPDT